MTQALSTYWFNFLTSHFLIYNICWEDPEIDRFLLNIDSKSTIFTITSAGDNVLTYLIDKPASIDCVDLNSYQNALFELKVALFSNNSHHELWQLFEHGKTKNYQSIYDSVRPKLSTNSAKYWDKHIHWFSPNEGFYSKALTGKFASFLKMILSIKGISNHVHRLLHEPNQDTRATIYLDKISPKLWSGFGSRLWKSNVALSLAGIPSNQKLGVLDLERFIKDSLYNIFVLQNPSKNHFWRLYLEGKYSEHCRPNYLEAKNFELISSQVTKVSNHVNSVTNFLQKTTNTYSHFVLLDHQDWLVNNGTTDLENEWKALLNRAKPGAKFLMRSVHPNLNFLPDFVQNCITNVKIDSDYLKLNDKIGTYPSTFLLTLNV